MSHNIDLHKSKYAKVMAPHLTVSVIFADILRSGTVKLTNVLICRVQQYYKRSNKQGTAMHSLQFQLLP